MQIFENIFAKWIRTITKCFFSNNSKCLQLNRLRFCASMAASYLQLSFADSSEWNESENANRWAQCFEGPEQRGALICCFLNPSKRFIKMSYSSKNANIYFRTEVKYWKRHWGVISLFGCFTCMLHLHSFEVNVLKELPGTFSISILPYL